MSVEWNITRKGRLKGVVSSETRNLVIPDGVKEIADGAFQWYKWIKSIKIPESVTRIGAEAFAECRGLKEIIIPESVDYIGQNAFYGTPWLEHYPDDFVIVNHILTDYKGSAEEISIPESVKVVGESVFSNPAKLWVSSPLRGKVYVNNQFRHRIRKVTFPEGLTAIERSAFQECENLTELYFPDGLKYIGQEAFKGCTNLQKIRIPETVRDISFEAFAECPHLKRVPLFVSHEKIFFTFPDKNAGVSFPSFFVDFKKYQDENTDNMLLPEVRHDLLFQIYLYHIDEAGAEKYLRKHFPEMIPVFVRLSDENLMQSFIRDFPELVKKYIDTLIMEANQQGNHELQIRFMDYKYQHCEFGQKDLYL